jgi:hypothetical protein
MYIIILYAMLFKIYEITIFKYKNLIEELKLSDFKIGEQILRINENTGNKNCN